MKKNGLCWFSIWGKANRKSIISLCMVLLMFMGGISSAFAIGQTQKKIKLKCVNQSIIAVLSSLDAQSHYKIFYKDSDVDAQKKVTIKGEYASLEEALTKVLGDSYTYKIVNEQVIILPKKKGQSQTKQKKATPRLVTGVVKDAKGITFPGVSIIVKGTTIGGTTDVDGNFKFKIPSATKKLVFSFVGYQNQEVDVLGKNSVTVVLKPQETALGEVVITGYQVIEKRKLSSSVVTIRGEEVSEGGAISVDNMLQGKVSGLAVMGSSSTPGAAPKIRVRGASSIAGNREPVWVVDGVILDDPVPLDAAELNDLDNVNLIGNAISSINPEDIARIDVLKDASATAIYGVKAANGVIVITTKKGKVGKTRVKYTNSLAWATRPSYDNLNLMNSQERIDVSKEIYDRGLRYSMEPANVAYEGALYDLFSKKITEQQFAQRVKGLEEQNTDWFDLLFRTALTQKHSVTISGANDKTNYYFSGGFTDSKATTIGSGLKQYNALMKLNFKLTKKLQLGLQLRGSFNDRDYQHTSIDMYEYAYNTSRAIACYDANGNPVFYNKTGSRLTNQDLNYNIMNELDNSGRNIQNQTLAFNANIRYKIKPWLNYTGLVSVNRGNTYEDNWSNDKTYYAGFLRKSNLEDFDPRNEVLAEKSELPYGGEIRNKNTKYTSYTVRNSLNLKKTFNEKHEINSTVGTEIRSTHYEGLTSIQRGYLPDRGKNFVHIDPTAFPAYKDWLVRNPDVLTDRLTNVLSYYGTVTYSYDDRYSINGNIRTDGSNKFGQDPDNRFLPVWSTSARWNIHNEEIFSGNMDVNLMALRLSYGVQGNVSPDQTPNLIIKQGEMDGVSHEYIATLDRLPNPFLRWEKTESYNMGFDFAFLKNRIGGSVEVYRKYGKDQIVTRKVSTTAGVRTVSINAGNLENKGWEFALRGQIIQAKDFSWGVSLNAYKNINKVTKSGISTEYNYSDYLYGRIIEQGMPLNGFYSYKFDGLNSMGYPTFKDTEETEGITKDEMYAKVFTYSGQRTPDFNGGFSSRFKYKNWSLNVLFSFSKGKKVRLNSLYKSIGQTLPQPQQNMSGEFVNRWRQPGDENNTNIPTISDNPLKMWGIGAEDREIDIAKNKWEMYNKSDLRVVDGDYIRLRNVTLRYHVAKHICRRLHVQGINFRLEGSNLKLWADSRLNGQDPDQMSFGGGATPITPSYVFGFDVTF